MENHLAVPRYKGDYMAEDTQSRIAAANAGVAALRNYPLNQAMTQDASAPVHFVESLGDYTSGEYSPGKKAITIAAVHDPEAIRNTLYHETIHDLQDQGDYSLGNPTPPASWNPTAVLDPTDWRMRHSQTQISPSEGTPEQFSDAIRASKMYYGTGEPEAWMSAGLNNPGTIDPQVRAVAAQFPGLSGMFAQQSSQPNRPLPHHVLGYPEMTTGQKVMNTLFGSQYDIPLEAKYSAMQQQVLRRLNEETNPRDRH